MSGFSSCSSGHFSGAAPLRVIFAGSYATHLVTTSSLAYLNNGDGPNHGHAPGNPSVLVVDDDHSIVDVFTRAIGSLGIHVVSASDGRRALAAAQRAPFNLWLLETKLPDLHGLDVVRELRAEGYKTPFIVVSGHATVQSAVEATKLGALSVLEKPVRLEELRNAIYQSLDVVRVYTKLPTKKESDHDKPFTLKRGGTLLDVAELVHRDLAATFKYARVWSTSLVAPGTQMKGDYVVHDKDVVEIHA